MCAYFSAFHVKNWLLQRFLLLNLKMFVDRVKETAEG